MPGTIRNRNDQVIWEQPINRLVAAPLDCPRSNPHYPRPWTDGDLLGVARAWEQLRPWRKPPVLVEAGLLAVTKSR